MKPIVAKDQIRLGSGRCLQLALSGMAFRMFRSSVTISILALAVAFLVQMVTFGIVSRETQLSAYHELSEQRRWGETINRLANADSRAAVLEGLHRGDEQRLREYQRWSALADAEFAEARQTAQRLNETAAYLQSLPPGAHAVLVGDLSSSELYDRLQQAAAFEAFSSQLESLSIRLPAGGAEDVRKLVQVDRPRLVATVDRIVEGHEQAIARLREAFPERAPLELAAAPPSGFAAALRQAGFEFRETSLPDLGRYATRALDLERINRLVLNANVRAALAREADIPVSDVSFAALVDYVDSVSRAEWLATTLRAADPRVSLDGPRVLELLEWSERERRLRDVVGEEAPAEHAGLFGMSARNQWLLLLSFLVCVVGVANAMLMSVTERFTEIATMKCLGAMDRFVMLMFVFEAVIQGAVGGVVGALLGVALAVIRGLVEYGTLLGGAGGAFGEALAGVALSIAVGMLLAAVAAVGPAWLAARLAPMEAMRVD